MDYIIQVPVVGVLMVFAVLAVLWGVLSVSKVVFYDMPRKRAHQSDTISETKKTPVVAAPVVPATPAVVTDDAAIVAAITAAIAAYQSASGQPNLPFRVVSFTRKNNASGWMGNSADNQ